MRRYNSLFDKEQEKFVRANVKGKSAKELTELVNNKFDLNLTVRQVESFKTTNRLKSGIWKASIKGEGAEREEKNNRIQVKVKDPETGKLKWKLKHYVIWEEAHGKTPAGHVLIFGDQDPTNLALDNLLLVSRRQLAVINKYKLLKEGDIELNKMAIKIADVILKTAERKKG